MTIACLGYFGSRALSGDMLTLSANFYEANGVERQMPYFACYPILVIFGGSIIDVNLIYSFH